MGDNEHIVSMWDYETRTVVRNRYGDIARVNDDAHENRHPLGSVSHFRGNSSLAFYSRDIFSADLESLTLVLERPGLSLRWSWRFTEAAHDGAVASKGPGCTGRVAAVTE
jgi:hypothetical protein